MTLESAKELLHVQDLSLEFTDVLKSDGDRAAVLYTCVDGNQSLPEIMSAQRVIVEHLVSEHTIMIVDVTKYQDVYSLVHHITELIELAKELRQGKRKSIALLSITGNQLKLIMRKIVDLVGLDTEFMFGTNPTELLEQAKQRVREIALDRA